MKINNSELRQHQQPLQPLQLTATFSYTYIVYSSQYTHYACKPRVENINRKQFSVFNFINAPFGNVLFKTRYTFCIKNKINYYPHIRTYIPHLPPWFCLHNWRWNIRNLSENVAFKSVFRSKLMCCDNNI